MTVSERIWSCWSPSRVAHHGDLWSSQQASETTSAALRVKTGWLVSTSTSARNSDNLVFIGWQSSESDSFKLMTSLTPRFSISKIRFEALLRFRLLRHWKLNLTEFASSLKFVELGLVNYAQCWEDVLLKAGKHRSKVRSGSFFFSK